MLIKLPLLKIKDGYEKERGKGKWYYQNLK